MNNTQDKSVSASSNKSKGSKSKVSEFIENQTATVQKLWHQCWRSDPYGSRWQVLNHTLNDRSFRRAKKILSDQGLFVFKPDHSISDGREVVCWLVMNLHGARRSDYWLRQNRPSDGKNCLSKGKKEPTFGQDCPTISDQSQ